MACCKRLIVDNMDLQANGFSGRLSEFRKQETSLPPALISVQVKTDEQKSLTHVLVFTEQVCRLELPATVFLRSV